MKNILFFCIIFFVLFSNMVTSDSEEIVVNLSIQVNDNSDFNEITGNTLYESNNEINKKRIYIVISVAFTLLLLILILRKKF